MIEKIKQYPDPILTTRCDPVDLDDPKTRFLGQRLLNACLADTKGRLAVAAPQIGVAKRAFAFNLIGIPDRPEGIFRKGVVYNPVITAVSDHTDSVREGCLSLKKPVVVRRPVEITLDYVNGKKEVVTGMVLTGMLARIFQHEIDHLNGVLITDHAMRAA